MSAAEAQAEPTMEEILASIRRIISEDDAPPAAEAAPAVEGEDVLELEEVFEEPAQDTHVSSDFDFDALPTEEPEIVDDDFFNEAPAAIEDPDEIIIVDREPEPEPIPEPIYSFDPEPEPEPVYTAPPVQETYQAPPVQQPVMETRALGQLPPQLAKTVGLVGDEAAQAAADAFSKVGPMLPHHFANGVSVEELVAHMLRPMLKEWLDANLPRIVEERVEAELARIARRGF